MSPAGTLLGAGAARQAAFRDVNVRGIPPAGAGNTVPPLRSRVVIVAVLKPALMVMLSSRMSRAAVTRTDEVPVARLGPVAVTATWPSRSPSSCALPLKPPAAMKTLGVCTPTIDGSCDVTAMVTPPAGAACVSVIGSDAVRVYGTLSCSGTEIVFVLTVTSSVPLAYPVAVAVSVTLPVEIPVTVKSAVEAPAATKTVAGAFTVARFTSPLASVTFTPPASAGWASVARTVAVPFTPTMGVFTNASAIDGAVTEKAALAALPSPGAEATSTQLAFSVSTVRSPKVAEPEAALRVVVPPSTADGGPLVRATVMGPVKLGVGLPIVSRAATVHPGVIGRPSAPPPVFSVKASWAGGDGKTVVRKLWGEPVSPAAIASTVTSNARRGSVRV